MGTKIKKAKRLRCDQACESCKRRKVRCHGSQPCIACCSRNQECVFVLRLKAVVRTSSRGTLCSKPVKRHHQNGQHVFPITKSPVSPSSVIQTPTEAMQHEMISAEPVIRLPLLQELYHMIQAKVGYRDFGNSLKTPAKSQLPVMGPSEVHMTTSPPPRPSLHRARYLLRWYRSGMSDSLAFINLAQLERGLSIWLESPDITTDAITAVYYLTLAIGAQNCPEKCNNAGHEYFSYGRYLVLTSLWDSGVPTIQSHLLVTIFLLNESRPDSSAMHLRIAVEAAVSLQIHRKPYPPTWSQFGFESSESLWRAAQILDISTAVALDRPPMTSTFHSVHPTQLGGIYTAFVGILHEARCGNVGATRAIELATNLRNRWITQWTSENRLPASESLSKLDYVHSSGTYYRSILLLSEPFLLRSAHASLNSLAQCATEDHSSSQKSVGSPEGILTELCLEAAVRVIDLLRAFVSGADVPKPLPCLVNSVFLSAVVLYVALFSSLGSTAVYGPSLQNARRILDFLGGYDKLAAEYLGILVGLENAYTSLIAGQESKVDFHCESNNLGQGFGKVNSTWSLLDFGMEAKSQNQAYGKCKTEYAQQVACSLDSWSPHEQAGDLGGEGLGVLEWWQCV
ncbi:hypothetical protein B0J13DRAFT_651738 [Dactylonectria estremocensis]|uniref:Zn(2)-C6 fungal-type domain-containing protein n=1 Tax=Dactylonectria estremocensis TaxID=1079267 RepID=A0A9P9DG63_9HYPO|nr:hypothetical protein B0J13DRAFT_651738 [Dactylonectria estremocensis]